MSQAGTPRSTCTDLGSLPRGDVDGPDTRRARLLRVPGPTTERRDGLIAVRQASLSSRGDPISTKAKVRRKTPPRDASYRAGAHSLTPFAG